MELSQKAKVKKFVLISSISVIYPIRTPYAESKYKAEECKKLESPLCDFKAHIGGGRSWGSGVSTMFQLCS